MQTAPKAPRTAAPLDEEVEQKVDALLYHTPIGDAEVADEDVAEKNL